MSESASNDLENFRKQWREEVLRKRGGSNQQSGSSAQSSSKKVTSRLNQRQNQGSLPFDSRQAREDDTLPTYDFDDLEEREEARRLGVSSTGVHPESRRGNEPVSALEHYEEAVEREKQGKLGESLNYYRKAFRVTAFPNFFPE